MDINGGKILLMAGEQVLDAPIIIGDGVDTPAGDIVVEGQGPSTVLKRGVDLAAGDGLFKVYGYNIVFRNFVLDGLVTTSSAIDYTLMSDPIADALTENTSFWLYAGAANVRFENVWIRNTGGYAILLDARTGDIDNFEFVGGGLENCRPHLISYPAGDGGGWNGGIMAKHLGTSGASGSVNGMSIRNASFKRMNGNAIWSHSNGFEFSHRNLNVTGCHFEDLCRDGVQPGNILGGTVSDNTFYRVGYITTTNTDTAVPNWPTGAPNAVALDTTGLAKDFKYNGNTFVDVNGTCIDGDGIHDSVIQGNTMSVSDGVTGYGPGGIGNYSTGIQPSNSYYKVGGRNLTISGNTIRNMGNAGISGSNLKNCQITDNNIFHPSTAAKAPIILFNKPGYDDGVYTTGDTDNAYRSHGNVIKGNTIEYSGSFHAIEEIVLAGGADYAYKSADINIAFNNTVSGAPGEFKKSSDSSSFAGVDLSTNDTTSTSNDTTRIQREGTDTTAVTKLYSIVAGTAKQLLQLSDTSFMNVSEDGVAGTGVIATGNRSTTAFDDCIVTGKLAADGFLSLTDTTLDTDANLLPDTFGLLKYDSTSKTFKKSTSVSSGTRVWTDFVSSVAGSDKHVQFNDGGSVAGSTNLTFDKTTKVLTITGTTGTAGIVAATSYIQAAEGFYSPGTSASTVNIPSGGVTALSLISVRNDGTNGLHLVRNSGSNQRSYSLGVGSGGKLTLKDETGSTVRLEMDSSGTFTIGSTTAIDQSGNITATGTVQSAGVNVTGSATNSLQVPTGGITALTGTFDALYLTSTTSTPATPSSSYASFTHKTGNVFHYYDPQATTWKTVDFSNVGTGVTSVTGTTNQVSVSASSGAVTFSLPQSIHSGATPTFSTLTLSSSASNALNLTSGSVSAVGVSVTGSAYNSIQAPTAGIYAGLGLTADQALYLKSFATATMNAPSGGYGGFAHKTGTTYWLYNGSSWAQIDLSTVGGGVTAVAVGTGLSTTGSTGSITLTNTGVTSNVAGTGISVSGATGAVTITNSGVTSLTGTSNRVTVSGSTGGITISGPQDIHSGASPTFAALSITSSASNAISVTGSISAAGYSASGSATNQIQAASGGVTAKYLVGTTSFTLVADTAANAGLSSAGQGRLYVDSTSNKFRISTDGGAYVDLLTTITGTSNQVVASAANGAITLSLPQSIHSSATPTFDSLTLNSSASNALNLPNGSIAAKGLAVTTTTAYNSIQSTAGGMFAATGFTSDNAIYLKTFATSASLNAPGGGYGALAHKSGSQFWIYNGSSFVSVDLATVGGGVTTVAVGAGLSTTGSTGSITLANTGVTSNVAGTGISLSGATGAVTITNSGVTSITGTTNQVTASASTGGITLSLPQSIHTSATPTFSSLSLSSTATNALHIASGYITSLGLIATNTAYNAIQSAGGVLGAGLTSSQSLYLASFGTATMNTPSAGYGAIAHKTGTMYWLWNGSSWAAYDFATIGGGVTSLTAGTGISVSGSTGAITITNSGVTSNVAGTGVSVSSGTGASTISIGQPVATSSNVQFATVATTSNAVIGATSASKGRLAVVGSQGYAYSAINVRCTARFSGDANSAILFDTTGAANASGYTRGLYWSYTGDDLGFSRFLNNDTGVVHDMYISPAGTVMVNQTVDDSSGAKLQVTGFVSATTGFYSASTATDAFKATTGGVTARYLIGTRSLTLAGDTAANAGLSSSGQGRIYFDSTANKFKVSEHGGSYSDLVGSTSQWTTTGSDIYFANKVSIGGTTPVVRLGQKLDVSATSDYGGIAVNTWSATGSHGSVVDFNKSGNATVGSHSAVASGDTMGFFVFRGSDGTAFQRAVEVNGEVDGTVSSGVVPGRLRFRTSNSSGTMLERWRIDSSGHFTAGADNSYDIGASGATRPRTVYVGTSIGIGTAPSVPLHVLGHTSREVARFQGSADASNNRNFITLHTTNPAYWYEFSNEDASGGGTANGLAFRERSGSGSSVSRVYFAQGGNVLVGTQTDDSTGAKVQVSGFVSATTGFYSASTSYQAVNIPNGGVYARSGHFEKLIHIAGNSGVPTATTGTSVPTNGQFYYDTSLSKFRAYEGGSWKDMISAGTSYSAGTGVSIASNVISIGQAVATSSSVTFGTVSSSGVVQAAGSGSTITFQNSSTYAFQVNGQGDVSGREANFSQGYKVNGSSSINSSNQFVGGGVNCPSYGVAASGFNPYSGTQYYGQTATVDGSFTIGGVAKTSLVFIGGSLVSYS